MKKLLAVATLGIVSVAVLAIAGVENQEESRPPIPRNANGRVG